MLMAKYTDKKIFAGLETKLIGCVCCVFFNNRNFDLFGKNRGFFFKHVSTFFASHHDLACKHQYVRKLFNFFEKEYLS